MPFLITSQRDASSVRYEKIGRLRPIDDGMVEAVRDGYGIIRCVRTRDVLLALNGVEVEGFRLSESGNRMIISGTDEREYVVLVKQVRGMIRDWPKKKAALFIRESISPEEE